MKVKRQKSYNKKPLHYLFLNHITVVGNQSEQARCEAAVIVYKQGSCFFDFWVHPIIKKAADAA